MHPHSLVEDQQLDGDHYGVYWQVWLSDIPQSTDINPAFWLGQDPEQREGFESLLGGSITADLENPVVSATLRINLGLGTQNISPYLTGGLMVAGRPLFDPGRYLTIYAKCFDPDPTVTIPPTANPPPTYQGAGLSVASVGAVSPAWFAGHQAGDIGLMFVQTQGQAVPIIPPGWALAGSGQVGASGGAPISVVASATFPLGTETTSGSITIPSGTITGDDLVLCVTSGGHTSASAFATVTDTNGGTWTRVLTSGQRDAYLFWRKAIAGDAGKTINVAGAIDSLAGGVTVFRGCVAGNPITSATVEVNGAGNNVHTGFLPPEADTMICCAVFNDVNDNPVTALTCTAPSVLTSRFESLSTGGFDSACTLWSALQVGVPTLTGSFTWTQAANQNSSMVWALRPAASGGVGNMLTVLWKRAASSSEPALSIGDSGDHQIAQILGFRGCLVTGSPFVSTNTSGLTAPDDGVTIPSMTTTVANCLVVAAVTNATDDVAQGSSAWANSGLTEVTGRTDVQSNVGTGGGFSVATGIKATAGATGEWTAVLDQPSSQVRYATALMPKTPSGGPTPVELRDLPWRPIFVGRIDRVNPTETDDLVVECRDIYADLLDTQIEGSFAYDGGSIEELLNEFIYYARDLGVVGPYPLVTGSGGTANLAIPAYVQESTSVLLAMRLKGLLNGWDLRGRFGTDVGGDDEYDLTYYAPDRTLAGLQYILSPDRYYVMRGLTKSRDDVRNVWSVTPADPPRTPIVVWDQSSIDKYGRLYAAIQEDLASGVRTPAQAEFLAKAALSDTKEPKVMAEIETRFLPWVEINDVIRLEPDNARHDLALTVAVSGYTHTFEDGDGSTVLRTRDLPAAANREWRQLAEPIMEYVSTEPPSGPAPEGATWTQLQVL